MKKYLRAAGRYLPCGTALGVQAGGCLLRCLGGQRGVTAEAGGLTIITIVRVGRDP